MRSIPRAKPNSTFTVENCDCSKGNRNVLGQSTFYGQDGGRLEKPVDFISFLAIVPIKIIQMYEAWIHPTKIKEAYYE
jgi:hypothetical protein